MVLGSCFPRCFVLEEVAQLRQDDVDNDVEWNVEDMCENSSLAPVEFNWWL